MQQKIRCSTWHQSSNKLLDKSYLIVYKPCSKDICKTNCLISFSVLLHCPFTVGSTQCNNSYCSVITFLMNTLPFKYDFNCKHLKNLLEINRLVSCPYDAIFCFLTSRLLNLTSIFEFCNDFLFFCFGFLNNGDYLPTCQSQTRFW